MNVTNSGAFVHPLAVCESSQVGKGSRVWAFAHILPNARIGRDCNICDGVFIENDVVVGDRVTIKCGVQLWDGVTLEDDVFVGPNATFANDLYPRSREHLEKALKTIVKRGASIGSNATILPDLQIGERAMIGAGAVVTRDVPARAIVVGNPGRIIGYTDTINRTAPSVQRISDKALGEILDSDIIHVGGCRLWRFPKFGDLRGDITVAEFGRHVPFEVKRIFFLYDIPGDRVRGEHAHRTCTQVLLPIKGSVSVVADDGNVREEIKLDDPSIGLLIPPKIWSVQYQFSAEAVLVVFCSEYYDANEYIREYDEFLAIVGPKQQV